VFKNTTKREYWPTPVDHRYNNILPPSSIVDPITITVWCKVLQRLPAGLLLLPSDLRCYTCSIALAQRRGRLNSPSEDESMGRIMIRRTAIKWRKKINGVTGRRMEVPERKPSEFNWLPARTSFTIRGR